MSNTSIILANGNVRGATKYDKGLAKKRTNTVNTIIDRLSKRYNIRIPNNLKINLVVDANLQAYARYGPSIDQSSLADIAIKHTVFIHPILDEHPVLLELVLAHEFLHIANFPETFNKVLSGQNKDILKLHLSILSWVERLKMFSNVNMHSFDTMEDIIKQGNLLLKRAGAKLPPKSDTSLYIKNLTLGLKQLDNRFLAYLKDYVFKGLQPKFYDIKELEHHIIELDYALHYFDMDKKSYIIKSKYLKKPENFTSTIIFLIKNFYNKIKEHPDKIAQYKKFYSMFIEPKKRLKHFLLKENISIDGVGKTPPSN